MILASTPEYFAKTGHRFVRPVLTLRYGLFCNDSAAPAMTFHTRFAATRKCHELNRREERGTAPDQWNVRVLDE